MSTVVASPKWPHDKNNTRCHVFPGISRNGLQTKSFNPYRWPLHAFTIDWLINSGGPPKCTTKRPLYYTNGLTFSSPHSPYDPALLWLPALRMYALTLVKFQFWPDRMKDSRCRGALCASREDLHGVWSPQLFGESTSWARPFLV